MNIRGHQLWSAYKDHCAYDIEKLIELVRERDRDLVDAINKRCAQYGEEAVCSGWSFRKD